MSGQPGEFCNDCGHSSGKHPEEVTYMLTGSGDEMEVDLTPCEVPGCNCEGFEP